VPSRQDPEAVDHEEHAVLVPHCPGLMQPEAGEKAVEGRPPHAVIGVQEGGGNGRPCESQGHTIVFLNRRGALRVKQWYGWGEAQHGESHAGGPGLTSEVTLW
jgi:hypothetical protein